MKYLPVVLTLAVLTSFSALAQEDTTKAAEPEDLTWMEDNPIVTALDSMWAMKVFSTDTFTTDRNVLNTYGFAPDSIPAWPDSVYAARYAALDNRSPFRFRYNSSIKSYMELYVKRRRSYAQRLLGLSEIYYPMFEEMLDRYDLPLELKHLAVVESGLNPKAKSRAGAAGLWQFMYRTGKMLGLDNDSYMDDRFDPYQATEAACQYLRYLHSMYDDWDLALAAYNAGPGNVNKAIRRAGGGKLNYWQVRAYLPRETQGYVPAFYGVVYFMNYPAEHNLYPKAPQIRFFDYDTVHVCDGVTFKQLSATLDIDYDLIDFLNPVYKQGIVPKPAKGQHMVLYLPREKVGEFITNESYIYSYNSDGTFPITTTIDTKVKQTHTVAKGEYLGSIARKYGCTVEELRIWNNIKSSTLSSGQKLVVYVPDTTQTESTTTTNSTQTTTGGNTEYIYHVVKKGDTLWDIANRYDGVTLTKIRQLNRGLDEKSLKTGQRIKIRVKS